MFDFLNSKLCPKIRCSTATMDGYDAENLISPNDLIKARGFLSYTSIKPPVDLDFELLCPISLGYVFVATTVGTQKTNGLELFARNGNEFVSIARAPFYGEDGVFFCNSRLFSQSSPPPNYNERYHLCFLKCNQFRVFINASHVRLRILRTDKSVPCIGRVEIWGRISKLCSATTANTIRSLMQPLANPTKNNSENNKLSVGTSRDNVVDEVPEEFKDALTFEIMSIPMTLPSGSTVDSSTLNKFIENEASHGRHPSDPFTGLKFTESRKPVLNTALKSRIDMFLLEHVDVAKTTMSRTVGKIINSPTKINELKTIKEINSKRKAETNALSNCDINNSTKRSKCDDDDDNELNVLIQKTVSAKGFIRFTVEEESEKQSDKLGCSECEAVECLYILPCKHLYCRKCLMDVCTELKCKHCCATFSRADPKKFHAV